MKALVIGVLATALLGAFVWTPVCFAAEEEPIDGGTTDNSVHHASPVVIDSRDISSFRLRIESGDYAVVRVEGIGEYTGIITKHFMITSSSGEDSDLPTVYSGSSGGCNSISVLGAALGLVFVIKKFRRS